MKILLYSPDNGVTKNFMPHLWMFLLQSLTPPGHEVVLIDGNAQPMDEAGIAQYVRENNIGLVGIGRMTRMIAKAYRMADAVRAVGVPVVMGGPHVTEMPDEALGTENRASAMPTRSLSAKRMRRGRGSWPTPRVASSKRPTLPWMNSARSASQAFRSIRQFRGIRSTSTQFNVVPKVVGADAEAVPRRLGNVSHHSRGVGARLPVRMRILHGDRLLWRFDPLSDK